MAGLRVVLVLGVTLSASVALASDWQYAGYAKTPISEAHLFFDTQSVSRPSQGVTRVWVKSIKTRILDRYAKTHEKLVTEKAARKVAVYYRPQFLELPVAQAMYSAPNALAKAAVEITLYEVLANEPDIVSETALYFEIDCIGKRYRLLAATLYKDDGTVGKSTTTSNSTFQFIAPDTNAERFSLLVCPSK